MKNIRNVTICFFSSLLTIYCVIMLVGCGRSKANEVAANNGGALEKNETLTNGFQGEEDLLDNQSEISSGIDSTEDVTEKPETTGNSIQKETTGTADIDITQAVTVKPVPETSSSVQNTSTPVTTEKPDEQTAQMVTEKVPETTAETVKPVETTSKKVIELPFVPF